MFCQSCGISCHEDANFCKSCGTALITDSSKRERDHHSNVNIQQPASRSNSTSQPLSFKAYMENRNVSQNQDTSFTAVQKRKTDERTHSIKKRVKKSEIVQVSLHSLSVPGQSPISFR